jgi:hypothetical protein
VNEEKNTCRVNAIQRGTRTSNNKYKQARSKERNQDWATEKLSVLAWILQATEWREKAVRNTDVHVLGQERSTTYELRPKEHFEQYFIKGEERDQPPDQVDLWDEWVEIDLPSRRFNCDRAAEQLRYCDQCTRKEINSIAKTIVVLPAERCIQSLCQIIIRPLVDLLQRGRSSISSWILDRQINDRLNQSNEYNIHTHNLFKAA